MNTLAKSLRFDAHTLWVELLDGRTLGVPLAWFPRLLKAEPEQLARYEISGGGQGIHWDELDEDVSVAALVAGHGDRSELRPRAA